ncbi:sugar porter family MFS transporter [Wenyingzhuangia sp. 2_MG-2023]|uniref:sugar porter family MFS transporter n=1 Tax=Wenyingzhuangia sp. 2_MG-2023 TaxID=3062639 RepID=UPI0026E40ED5|nr:sugar porter family MFS transporter [Wenyingzhuangia sp. 2_MG-2023]MDO6737264.1 sugar porter family MFS transporter [Wenyingzhuangia sp. 2_MG-2023]
MKSNKAYLVGVTLVATLGGFLFGYDTGVISGADKLIQLYFTLSATEIGFVVSSALLGCMLGSTVSGVLSKRFGRKKSMLFAAILFFISAMGSALPESVTELVIYRLLGGIGVGLASAIAPVYIAEIAPSNMRGKLVSINQLAIVMGFVVVFFVNYFIKDPVNLDWNLNTGWRYMFGSECIPALLFFLLLLIVPYSPRWLVMKNRNEEALSIITKVNGAERAAEEMIEIKDSLKGDDGKSFSFKYPKIGLIILIGVALSFFQQVTGINAIMYYGPRIFESMNLPGDVALVNQIVVGLAMMIFTIIAIFTVEKLGRKPLLIWGTVGMGVCIILFGVLMYNQYSGIFALVVLVGYIAFFSLSQGPIVWVYLSELFPNKVRGAVMSMAVLAQWTANYLVSQTFPMMADESGTIYQTFHGGFPFWLYGIFCFIAVVFTWKMVPETKGKSLEQIETYWSE